MLIERHQSRAIFLTGDGIKYSRKGICNSKNHAYQIVKSEKYKTFCVSKLLIWRQNWVARVRQLARRVSPGRIIVVLFLTRCVVPRQIKPRILKLSIRKGESNLSIVFIFVCCEEKGYCRVVLVGKLGFDGRSYCWRSHRMQGLVGDCSLGSRKLVFFKYF